MSKNEYRNLPLDQLVECPLNPRRTLDEKALNELAESIRTQGVLMPLLVRPVNPQTYEVVAGKRRFRAAQLAGVESVPVDIRELTDAECIEIAITENLQRRDVHPLEESSGYARLLSLDEPKYSIEQIAAKCAKTPAYIVSRLSLASLTPDVTEAFVKDEIGLGHALLLAKLQSDEQEHALSACYQEVYGNGSKPRRILLPVRHLKEWIERNVLLDLAAAPFSKDDATLVPDAGACANCPKRTGHNTLLFEGMSHNDRCSDPRCFSMKLDQHVKQTVAQKPKLVRISTAYGKPADGSPVMPRNKYVEIRQDKPKGKNERDWPEFKTCKYTTEAIVTEGMEKGEQKKICAHPECPVHHPKRQNQRNHADAAFKAEQEKRRREESIAQTTGMRVLKAIGDAVPVRLMKRDLLFLAEWLTAMLDERRLSVLIRQYGIGKQKDDAAPAKMLAAFLPEAEEGKLGRILIETAILLSMHNPTDAAKVLRDAAHGYKVDVDAISANVKQEFAAKEKAKTAKKPASKPQPKSGKKAAA
ncbi:MAG TPA: ParB/RepB/Spo0J family partition protein [Terracidiphilus sp.]|nr:ParB/RepB/Spo0J family partition protein [Terracidiphilus sp.]